MLSLRFLFFLLFPLILLSESINIEKQKWQLIGFPYDVNLSLLNLNSADIVWTYKNGNWYCYKKDYDLSGKCNEIDLINGGAGFWFYTMFDNTLTVNDSTPKQPDIKAGWNLVTFGGEVSVADFFNNENVIAVWGYKNGKWFLYTPDNLVIDGIETLTTIGSTDAVWVYAKNDLANEYVYVGNNISILNQGNFIKVVKNSSDDIEDIWNISFKIDTSNVSDFNIGIKFVKESTGAIGELVFTGLSISNGVINTPTYIIVYGEKSNGDNGETYFYSKYNPNNILSNAVVLNGDILTLKLGTIMKEQSIVDESTFKALSNYNIKIVSDKLVIKESKTISLSSLTTYGYDFYSNGLEGYIEIK